MHLHYMHNLVFVYSYSTPKIPFCPYLALLLTFTYMCSSNVALITVIDANCPDLTICVKYNQDMYSSIEAASLWQILEQSDMDILNLQKVSSRMQLNWYVIL